MRHAPNCKAEKYRVRGYAGYGNNGAFVVPSPCGAGERLKVLVSDGMGWDHVSVSVVGVSRTPHWAEMCFVKRLFFRDDECAMQLHPPEADYVNDHEYVLHLWRPQRAEETAAIRGEWLAAGEPWLVPVGEPGPIPRPPEEMV